MTRDVSSILQLAEKRIERVEVHLHLERSLIETLRFLKSDTAEAETRLHKYERLRARFIADRDRLREELEQATSR